MVVRPGRLGRPLQVTFQSFLTPLQMLSERLIPFVALDVSASRVQVRTVLRDRPMSTYCSCWPIEWRRTSSLTDLSPVFVAGLQEGKKADLPVYFGDAGSPAVLHAVGADKAACAVRRGGRRAGLMQCCCCCSSSDRDTALRWPPLAALSAGADCSLPSHPLVLGPYFCIGGCSPSFASPLFTRSSRWTQRAPTTAACGPCTSTSPTSRPLCARLTLRTVRGQRVQRALR